MNPPAHEAGIQLYPEQQVAKESFLKWFENNADEQIFRIFGYAGTGKTTITQEIIKEVSGRVLFGAFTGKAALVMQRNKLPARTIHSLIYTPIAPSKSHAAQIKKEIEYAQSANDKAKERDLWEELKSSEQLQFELNQESPLKDAALLVLDECSMINDAMAKDILSFKIPLLILGDPGQLPPIKGTGALIREQPNILLEKIHRQALDNPIIDWSFKARTGRPIGYGDVGKARKITAPMFMSNDAISADQILTGKNKTRLTLNTRARQILGYSKSKYPVLGDKLICLRNNRKLGIFNGMLCKVTEKLDEYDISIEYRIKTEDGESLVCRMLRAYFDEYATPGTIESLKWWDLQEAQAFDFGYAITVHKSQGSQWSHVVLYDDNFFSWDKMNRRRWLYTGITRAADHLTIVG